MTQETIGRYIVQGTIGEGAMGTVYRAHDPIIQREVAIKTIRVDRLADVDARETFKARFFREARIGGSLQDPNIVTLYDLGEHQGNPFIVMEFVKGDLLAGRMVPGQPLPLEMFLSVANQIANALETAHEHGIIHRDIKPQNIMLTDRGVVKILDFGIAKMDGSDMTQTGQFIGTPKYSSPEQIAAKKVDSRSDIFSLAVVAHEMMSGYNPFAGSSLNSILFKIAHGEPTLSRCAPEINVDHVQLHGIFRKALQKDPVQRFARATDFSKALQMVFEAGVAPGDQTVASTMIASELSSEKTMVAPRVEQTHAAETYQQKLEKEIEEGNRREGRILQLKTRFQNGLRESNKEECESVIRHLREEKADVVSEEKALEILISKLNADERERKRQEQERQRQRQIETQRDLFKQCLEKNDHDAAQRCIADLERLNASTDREKKLLAKGLEREKEQRRLAEIERTRQLFETAIAAKDLQNARAQLATLKREGAKIDAEQTAFAKLEDDFREREKQLRARTQSLRSAFRTAVQARNTVESEGLIKNLQELGAPCQDEEQALERLRQSLKEDAHKRDAQIKSRRKQIRTAVKQKDPALARQHLEALATLNVDLAAEEKLLADLIAKLAESERKKQERRIKTLEKGLTKAIKAKNIDKANQQIDELKALGVDTAVYRASLTAVNIVGPPEQTRKPILLWGSLAAATILGLATWLIWTGKIDFGKPDIDPNIKVATADPDLKKADLSKQVDPAANLMAKDIDLPNQSGSDQISDDDLNNPPPIKDREPDVIKKEPITTKDADRFEVAQNTKEKNTKPSLKLDPPDKKEADVTTADIAKPDEKQATITRPTIKEDKSENKTLQLTPLDKKSTKDSDKIASATPPSNEAAKKVVNTDASLTKRDKPNNDKTPAIDLTPPEKDTPTLVEEKPAKPKPIDLSFLKSFNHTPEGSYKLSSDTIAIEFNLNGLPREQFKDARISWRIGRSKDYASLPMTLSGSGFAIEIPTKELKQGKMEYFFTLSMADGKDHLLDDTGKPFITRLKKISAQGF